MLVEWHNDEPRERDERKRLHIWLCEQHAVAYGFLCKHRGVRRICQFRHSRADFERIIKPMAGCTGGISSDRATRVLCAIFELFTRDFRTCPTRNLPT